MKPARTNFDRDWLRHIGDVQAPFTTGHLCKARTCINNGAATTVDETNWTPVTLPDDALIDTPITDMRTDWTGGVKEFMGNMPGYDFANGSKPREVVWYRKHFDMPEATEPCRIFLQFDGVMRNSTVYLNQYEVGRHASGYTSHRYDITDFVREKNNLLAVRADPREIEGWWYQGSGLYRHVALITTPEVYIDDTELCVRSKIDGQKATVRVGGVIVNKTENDFDDVITCRIRCGEQTVEAQLAIHAKSLSNTAFSVPFIVENFKAWDIDEPNLYIAELSLDNGSTAEVTFGIREAVFDAQKGFLLNGRRVEIKGVCLHMDHAAIGTAQYDCIHEYRLKKLKELGCNAVRPGHHAPSPEFLDACDRLGFLVLGENRMLSSSQERLAELETMIKRDRNHPSIILWSIGNEEIRLQRDLACADKICRTVRRKIKSLDVRPITEAYLFDCAPDDADAQNRADRIMPYCDVIGFNYSNAFLDEARRRYPDKAFLWTEQSSFSATRGAVANSHEHSRFLLSHLDAPKQTAEILRDCPWMCGAFYWTGFDYYGEPSPFDFPAVTSQFGILDLCGYKKQTTAYYENLWKPDEEAFSLAPHWNEDDSANGNTRDVILFGRFDRAELFVNGKSVGERTVSYGDYAKWEGVTYEKGELTAKVFRGNTQVASLTNRTTGTPVTLRLTHAFTGKDASGRTLAIVDIDTQDADGRFVPTATDTIRVQVPDGFEVRMASGDPQTHEISSAGSVKLFYGRAQAVVVYPTDAHGTIAFAAANLGCAEIEL